MTASGRAETPCVTLPPGLRLGPVHLIVPDVGRSIAWYERALGLVAHRREASEAELGDGFDSVVVLHEDQLARAPGRHAGLYHYALLYPDRRALAHAAMRLALTDTRVHGASDHGSHEAMYLTDADGNGIELAADRPRARWPAGLGYQRGPAPLALASLLAAAKASGRARR